MPGIFGLINSDHSINNEDKPFKLSNLLKHEYWENSSWINNLCMLGVVELNTIKCINIINDKNMKIMGVSRGQIFNKNELSIKFNIDNDPFLNDIKFITKLYEKIGLNYVKYIKGIFNIALYDIEKDRMLVVNDRYCFYPIFYSLNDDGFAFASEVKGVLEGLNIAPEIDKNAVPEFLSIKYPLGERTFFKQVKKLQPATILIYDRTKQILTRQRYWNYPVKRQIKYKNIDFNNMLKTFKKLMERAICRTIQDKKEIGIFLSGGLDSTILTAFASETNSNVTTYTFGHKNCKLEKQIAKNIASELGVKNIFYEIPSDFIKDYANKIVYQGDGLIRIRESHFISCLKDIRKKNDTILIGTMGDIFRSNMFNYYKSRIKTRLKGKKGIKEYFFSRRTSQLPLSKYHEVFNKHFYLEAINAVKVDFNKDFNRIIGTNHIKPYDMFRLWSMRISFSKGLAQQFQYMNWYLETRHPFLDYDLFNFALSLPYQLKEENRFLKKAMRYCFPKLCNIELEHGYSFKANRLEYYLGKFKLSMFKRIHNRKTSIDELDYRDYGNWLRGRSKEFVMEVLNNSKSLKKYFKQDFIKKTLKDHMSGKEDKNELICDLINLELIHRIFLKTVNE